MIFNSIDFALFLPIIFILYWFVFNRNKYTQNAILIIASYYFYACWDWRFLFLLIFSTLLDYVSGIKIEKSKSSKEATFWFWLSIGINLGFLGIFKYYNFFAQSFTDLLDGFGFKVNPFLIKVILPVGISFYTFHGLSYVIDVYKKRIKAEYNFIDYSLFVSYFPLLVAGPIERATHLLPQVKVKRNFNYEEAKDGLKRILWGLFKKVVIADNCAEYVNMCFESPESYHGSTLLLGGIFFAFQIYGDFSGYSDIALGTSKLFGIDLLKNFSYPYFSRSIAEFWRRWHISLSTWFRDYLYIPLGGSKVNINKQIRNTFIIFIVSGFWHGANWTFIFWGLLNAIYIIPSIIYKKNRNHLDTVAEDKLFISRKELLQVITTFFLTVIAWIFFRADNLSEAFIYLKGIFNTTLFSKPENVKNIYVWLLIIFIIIEWIGRNKDYAIKNIFSNSNVVIRWIFYYIIFAFIFYYNFNGKEQQFIYFQF